MSKERVVLITHEQDGTDTIRTPTREIRGLPLYCGVLVGDWIEYDKDARAWHVDRVVPGVIDKITVNIGVSDD